MTLVKRPSFVRLCSASLGAYWLADIINPGFIWIALWIMLIALLFAIEDYVIYSGK